jgi:uncharacterized YccA/Bax inhibitor family protein
VATSNPALSDEALKRAVQSDPNHAGWAAPGGTGYPPPGYPPPPAPDTVSPWTSASEPMTINGTLTATGVLLVLLLATGVVGWNAVEPIAEGASADFPGWIWAPFIVAIGAAFATIFRPQWARFTAPLYALAQGVVVGAISRMYEIAFDGIVLQAAMSTIAVLGIMLFLYATRIVKVTDKMRMGIIMATGAIAIVYVIDLLLNLFGADVPYLHDTGTVGIIISLVIVGVAAMNLLLDFDFVERAVAARAPKQTEWYAGFGLVLTLVWLYLEMLRLLGKLRQ